MPNRLLLIGDDEEIVARLRPFLMKEGYEVTAALDGLEGVVRFRQAEYDIVVVDLMMPKLDGIEVIKRIREHSAVPILIMSAKDSDVDKAVGLELGADDYIAKPFSLIEFTARLKAAIRRATVYANRDVKQEVQKEMIYRFGGLTVNLSNYAVMKHEVRVLIYAVAASGMSLIPLYFGMRKYSTPTTIVSSIIIAAIINSSFGNNSFTLASVIAIPLALACVGVFVAYLAIRNVERVDVVN